MRAKLKILIESLEDKLKKISPKIEQRYGKIKTKDVLKAEEESNKSTT